MPDPRIIEPMRAGPVAIAATGVPDAKPTTGFGWRVKGAGGVALSAACVAWGNCGLEQPV